MTIELPYLALIATACLAAFSALTFWRSGAWKKTSDEQGVAAAQTKLEARVEALEGRMGSVTTSAIAAALEMCLSAAEDCVKNLPTANQLTKLTGTIETLEARLTGRLDTIAAELRGADQARSSLQMKVDRIEQHLLEASRAA